MDCFNKFNNNTVTIQQFNICYYLKVNKNEINSATESGLVLFSCTFLSDTPLWLCMFISLFFSGLDANESGDKQIFCQMNGSPKDNRERLKHKRILQLS